MVCTHGSLEAYCNHLRPPLLSSRAEQLILLSKGVRQPKIIIILKKVLMSSGMCLQAAEDFSNQVDEQSERYLSGFSKLKQALTPARHTSPSPACSSAAATCNCNCSSAAAASAAASPPASAPAPAPSHAAQAAPVAAPSAQPTPDLSQLDIIDVKPLPSKDSMGPAVVSNSMLTCLLTC